MATQQELDKAAHDALALSSFMTNPAGTQTLNSQGTDIGTLESCKADFLAQGSSQLLANVGDLVADTSSYDVGTTISTLHEGAVFKVVAQVNEAHLTTQGGVHLQNIEGPYVIAITGQSNAAGANDDGPNPASRLVHVWDGVTAEWGSSDRTQAPMSRANPHGNLGNNNYALARAHRVAADTGRPVFIVFDAQGGQSIDEWVESGTASPRYIALANKITAALATTEMVGMGKAVIDELIIAQGEADFESDFATYLAKINTCRIQIRAENWCADETPFYMMAPSDLHDRYQWRDAMRHMCMQDDTRCVFVPSNGLRTEYGLNGSGDYTHFLGESLWEAGYSRIADATGTEGSPTCFYGRGTGPVDATDATAMTTFRTLVSRDSWTTEIPPNGPAATGSISWGEQCTAEGNYTFALGYQCGTDNLANYGIVAGRSVVADDATDYFAAFGFQHTLSARYTFASGRGNTVCDEGGTAIGMFTQYATAETDRVMFQVGIGASTSTRANALTARKSGRVEMPSLPLYADNATALLAGLGLGNLYRTSAGDLKVVV